MLHYIHVSALAALFYRMVTRESRAYPGTKPGGLTPFGACKPTGNTTEFPTPGRGPQLALAIIEKYLFFFLFENDNFIIIFLEFLEFRIFFRKDKHKIV